MRQQHFVSWHYRFQALCLSDLSLNPSPFAFPEAPTISTAPLCLTHLLSKDLWISQFSPHFWRNKSLLRDILKLSVEKLLTHTECITCPGLWQGKDFNFFKQSTPTHTYTFSAQWDICEVPGLMNYMLSSHAATNCVRENQKHRDYSLYQVHSQHLKCMRQHWDTQSRRFFTIAVQRKPVRWVCHTLHSTATLTYREWSVLEEHKSCFSMMHLVLCWQHCCHPTVTRLRLLWPG